MELKRAKEVLEGMNLDSFSKEKLFCLGKYLHVIDIDKQATLEAAFTADQLEAIATWMRDPEGVTKA